MSNLADQHPTPQPVPETGLIGACWECGEHFDSSRLVWDRITLTFTCHACRRREYEARHPTDTPPCTLERRSGHGAGRHATPHVYVWRGHECVGEIRPLLSGKLTAVRPALGCGHVLGRYDSEDEAAAALCAAAPCEKCEVLA